MGDVHSIPVGVVISPVTPAVILEQLELHEAHVPRANITVRWLNAYE